MKRFYLVKSASGETDIYINGKLQLDRTNTDAGWEISELSQGNPCMVLIADSAEDVAKAEAMFERQELTNLGG